MATPFLIPIEPEEFFARIQQLVETAISKKFKEESLQVKPVPNGLLSNPLLSLKDVCALFKISKPTLYEWSSHGKLKPYKIRGKVYFLQSDIQSLFDDRSDRNPNKDGKNAVGDP